MEDPVDILLDHVAKKSPRGIPYSEAVQLMLLLYVAVDVLPEELRGLVLTKQSLAMVFSQLAVRGLVLFDGTTVRGDVGSACGGPDRPEHWEELAERLLRGKVSLDDTFLKRVSRYV